MAILIEPPQNELSALQNLSDNAGFLKKIGNGSYSIDTNSYLTANQSITISGDATGSGTTNIALTLANSGVTAGFYNNSATQVRPFAVDNKGRITAVGTAVTITPAWASITGKPTTLSGFGITDALSLSGGTVTGVTNFSLGLSVRNQGFAPLQLINLAKTEAGLSTSYAFYNMKAGEVGGLSQNCFSIYTYTSDNFKSIPFVILDNDNVGIGTTAPTTKLDVVGTVTASSFSVGNNRVVSSRKTGWTAPTGTATRTTFAPATVTLPQLAERVKGLIDDLTAHGLIGA